MSIEIKVPVLPESVTDATVVTWHKKKGERVKRDENIVDLETDKVVLEVPAPEDGVLSTILKKPGEVVKAGEILATLDKGATMETVKTSAAELTTEKTSTTTVKKSTHAPQADVGEGEHGVGPAARRARRSVPQQGVSLEGIQREDKAESIARHTLSPSASLQTRMSASISAPSIQTDRSDRIEKRVPMPRLRARIAERLLAAQHNAAILTTFNEINLRKVIELRAHYKELFEKKYNTRLGFMSFFTKAVVEALKNYPAVNASIDGNDIIYHNYFDIGIAVATDRGLVVPILRDADTLSFADIEKAIANYGRKAKENQITMEDMTGGTFTVTNGGVFGSLLATPIINPPQSAILGMNKIEERPIVEEGQIVIRPMMYVALSYDHRIIDGKESVGFLRTIKEFLEDPARLLIAV
jgi:2-oxoglutarate dehydrogenase E2 component (dihydrolipoamide succinyltransferase)